MHTNYFLWMVKSIRQNEEVMLYANILEITEEESIKVIEFLKSEYQLESFNYPFCTPAFNSEAALWAAKLLYIAAQLMLYRENKEADLEKLITEFNREIKPSEILSADLCLRFLPAIIVQLKIIDPEDRLISILEGHLKRWHYSAINYTLEIENLDFKQIHESPTLEQLYINRIIEYKKIKLAKLPKFKQRIDAHLGIYVKEFWNEFNIETSEHE